MKQEGYVITEDTKGCLHCGLLFEAKRSDAIFCGKECNNAFNALKPAARYLNAPIINRSPLQHNDLYTSHGQEMQLESGIMRVRLRYQDPAVVAKEKKDEQPTGKHPEWKGNPPKRRGA